MKSDLWTIISGSGVLALLWRLSKVIRKFLQERSTKKTEADTSTAELTRESSYLSSLTFVFAIAFGLLLIVAFSHEQTSLIQRLLAAGVGGIGLLGWLIQSFGMPAYEYTLKLEDRCARLEERVRLLEIERRAPNKFLPPPQEVVLNTKQDVAPVAEPKRKPSAKSTNRRRSRSTKKKKDNSD